MHARLTCALALAGLLAAPGTFAQPAGDKGDAKALVQTGVRLLEAKDYLGALAIFKDAYARFPSAKILLNIGTTFKLLGRNADAANAYQRYLDSSDADANRRTEVSEALAELDKDLGRLQVNVTPADAELKVTDDWIAAPSVKLLHVAPGNYSLQARRGGYQPSSQSGTIAAGEQASITISLAAVPEAKPTIIEVPRDDVIEPEAPRSRFGAVAVVHVSVVPKVGSAWLVGATADVTPALAVEAAVLLGPGLVSDGMATLAPPSFGGYAGASFAFMTDKLRPRVSAGIPIFASDGARFFVRAAAGLEYVASRHISLAFDLGAEVALNPQDDIRDLAVVPALGVAGRL
jgi:hypothetical protein